MKISKKDIEYIADLAHLKIHESEIPSYMNELTSIFNLIQKMNEIDTSNIDPMSHPRELELRLRPDEVTEPNQRAEILDIAPETENNLFLVPKVLD